MWYVLVWWLALVTLPGLVLIAGSEISDRAVLTTRGVNVVWGGVFVALLLVGAALMLLAPRYGV